MKRKSRFILGLAVLLGLTQVASARMGHDAGNGGYVVRCDHFSPQGNKVELLDFHEIRTAWHGAFTLDLGIAAVTEWDKVRYALSRLARLDAKRAANYQQKADHFLENANFIPNITLPDAGDANLDWIENGCKTEQAALQRAPIVPEQRLYTISLSLYNELTAEHRAGLILHEIIYGEAIQKGQTTSTNSRYLTALVSSSQIAQMSLDDYEKRMVAMGFDQSSQPQPPLWTQDPIALPFAVAGNVYTQDLTPFVHSPGGRPLVFSKISGPSWMVVGSNGVIMGTPALTDVGQATAAIAVSDGTGTASVGVYLNVIAAPQGQIAWTADPIHLGTTPPNVSFSFNLATYVTGNPTRFSIRGAPPWLSVSQTGLLSGTPGPQDVSDFVFEVSAYGGASGDVTKVVGTVGSPGWDLTVKVGDSLSISLSAPSGTTFRLNGPENWLSLASNGVLTARPQRKDIGVHAFGVTMTDATGHFADRILSIQVLPNSQPPIWSQDPIKVTAKAKQPFSASIFNYVVDPNNEPLTCVKMSGPSWAVLTPSCGLSGTPSDADVGISSFIVSARNQVMGSEVMVVVTVVK